MAGWVGATGSLSPFAEAAQLQGYAGLASGQKASTAKATVKNKKTTHRMRDIFENDTTRKGLISKRHRQLLQLANKTTQRHRKTGRRPQQTFLQRKLTDGPGTRTNAPCHGLLEERKSKLQRGPTSHLSAWPSLTSPQINAGQGVEKGHPPTLLVGL